MYSETLPVCYASSSNSNSSSSSSSGSGSSSLVVVVVAVVKHLATGNHQSSDLSEIVVVI